MHLEQYEKEVLSVDWSEFTDNRWYVPTKVAPALIALARADTVSLEGIIFTKPFDPETTDVLLNTAISNQVLFAIGNNHAGAYYSAVRKALPFIFQVALDGNHRVARNVAINCLIDLHFFDAACGSEYDSEELRKYVTAQIEEGIRENRSNFLQFAETHPGNRALVESLFYIVDEE